MQSQNLGFDDARRLHESLTIYNDMSRFIAQFIELQPKTKRPRNMLILVLACRPIIRTRHPIALTIAAGRWDARNGANPQPPAKQRRHIPRDEAAASTSTWMPRLGTKSSRLFWKATKGAQEKKTDWDDDDADDEQDARGLHVSGGADDDNDRRTCRTFVVSRTVSTN